MFVRFRQTEHRLQVSLVETRRVDSKVRHEHVAGLGSVEVPPTVMARLAFWQRLHERLAKLSNRIDAATQGKVLGDIHARIPMVTLDEQRALQLVNAEADERFWTGFKDLNEEAATGHKALSVNAERTAASQQARASDAAANAVAARDRAERIKRGEDVPGGIGKPVDIDAVLAAAGFSKTDSRRAVQLSQVCDAFGFEKVLKILLAERERADRAAVRALHRRLHTQHGDKEL
jgi:hypothetical protein